MLIWWDHATTMTHHLSDPTRGPMARCSRDAHQSEREDLLLPYQPEPPAHFGLIFDTGPAGYGTAPWATSPARRPDHGTPSHDHDHDGGGGGGAGRAGGHGH